MPYLTKPQMDAIAARVLRAYQRLPALEGKPIQRVDPLLLSQDLLGLTVLHRRIATSDDILGLTSPGEVDIAVIDEQTGELTYQHMDGKTIIVNISALENEKHEGHYRRELRGQDQDPEEHTHHADVEHYL